jgi:hypothetical protein
MCFPYRIHFLISRPNFGKILQRQGCRYVCLWYGRIQWNGWTLWSQVNPTSLCILYVVAFVFSLHLILSEWKNHFEICWVAARRKNRSLRCECERNWFEEWQCRIISVCCPPGFLYSLWGFSDLTRCFLLILLSQKVLLLEL